MFLKTSSDFIITENADLDRTAFMNSKQFLTSLIAALNGTMVS